MATNRDAPRKPATTSGKWLAFMLAVGVNLVFVGVLFFSIRWQSRPPEPIVAELYAPPGKAPPVESPPARPPPVQPAPEPKPEPPPPPEPRPEPAPPPKPAPPIEKPDTSAADIAQKAKQEEDRKKREKADRDKQEAEKKKAEEQQRIAEQQRVAEQQRIAEQLRLAEQKRIADQKRLAAVRDQQMREAEAESQANLRDQQRRDAAARNGAYADYVKRVQDKIRGNVIVPPDAAPNLLAVFNVVQLPTGEIIDVKLDKPSGNRAYDDAVQRAILKSSPLPRPDRPDIFQRELRLEFKPQD